MIDKPTEAMIAAAVSTMPRRRGREPYRTGNLRSVAFTPTTTSPTPEMPPKLSWDGLVCRPHGKPWRACEECSRPK